MAFLKRAWGSLATHSMSPDSWWNFLADERERLANGSQRTASQAPNLVVQASEILGETFDPSNYLLSHVTIVASVDTEDVPGVKLGAVETPGGPIVRKWGKYHITAESEPWINSNGDSWDRPVLLKSYKTFVGAHNFCFTPDTPVMMADGTYRPIRDVAVGDRVMTHLGRARAVTHKFVRPYVGDLKEVYVDRFQRPILATPNHPFRAISVEAPILRSRAGASATSHARYRRDQIKKALRGESSTFETKGALTRGLVSLLEEAPRTLREIVDAGYARDASLACLRGDPHLFERRPMGASEATTREPRERNAKVWVLREGVSSLHLRPFHAEKAWASAEDLEAGAHLLGPELSEGTSSRLDEATLLGYYAAEGCLFGPPSRRYGFVLSFGPHERTLATHASELAERLFEDAKVRVSLTQTTLRVEVNSKQAAQWAQRMAGHLAPNKRLDESVFSWDRESLLHLLAAWVSGDGNVHQHTFRIRGTSTSKNLADQMLRVAECAGLKACVVFEKQKIGEVSSQVTLTVGGEPRAFDVIPRHHAWTVLVSEDSIHEITTRGRRWGRSLQRVRATRSKRDDLAWWGDCRVHRVSKVLTTQYAGEVHNLEVEEDHSYVVDHGVAVHNCEHVQVPSLSKGRIIDAVARDIGPSVYTDILVATARKHAGLIRDIEEGKMGTLSMGCSCVVTQCTKCGNVAADETELCPCVKYEKGNVFFDEQGARRKVAELCGNEELDPTGGITFIEASWVATPAFKGAVLRNVLEPEVLSVETRRRATEVLSSPPREWVDPDTITVKAARELGTPVHARALVAGDDEFGGGGDVGGAPGGDSGDGSGDDPLSSLESEVEKYVLDRIKNKIKKKLTEDVGANVSTGELGTSTSDSVIHQGSLRVAKLAEGIGALLRIARSEVELLDSVARLEASFNIKTSREIYRAALGVGSTERHPSLETYLARCAEVLDRRPTTGEARTLVRLGRILSLWKRT